MKSLKKLYKIGHGPSSSHTMGPQLASKMFKKEFPNVDYYEVTLYGSLALTGKGHLTDYIIIKTLNPKETKIVWKYDEELEKHPNAMKYDAIKDGKSIGEWIVYSIGGGIIEIDGKESVGAKISKDVYKEKNFKEIKKYCNENNIDLYEYAIQNESEDFIEHIKKVWDVMKISVEEGLTTDGILKGGLKLPRRAKTIYKSINKDENSGAVENKLVSAYAFAVNEVNASAGKVVTSPTCGAAGTIPAVLYYLHKELGYSNEEIIKGLIVAGIIGNVIKSNASISGAEAGCQAEVGSACAMASAAKAYVSGASIQVIENSASIALEHNLGLTCDPILGLVQIPCIERNALAAIKAISAARLAISMEGVKRHMEFDTVVKTMYKTGLDMQSKYKETSEGGLASFYKKEMGDKNE